MSTASPEPESPLAPPDTVDDRSLRGLAGYQLRRADLAMQQYFVREIGEPFDLRQVEFSVLILLAANAALTHKQISESLGVAPSNMVAVMNKLAGRMLIERHEHPHDGRSFLWCLTAAGQTLEAEASGAVARMEARVLGDAAGVVTTLDALWSTGAARRD
ncbi:MarR family winged helix-turn-helix transcriptional regulator [Salinisphaera sp. Q1T1-3]|uniref:MarR family winged helix-turn-helix transcriptional regulator n=1 Tax=Salinisphaera sp. Q1T1-3 TaxID=2321229 RepID=UPI000E7614DB|nr:MarR family winged helix-turn-helix transcriptional regulator [Salinisphaera sp. Q1T1-3]RJS91082.1 MarR family transcriptional regulator [Salinisphaera sp. Q1T1-3]